jgi:hypothetical protein
VDFGIFESGNLILFTFPSVFLQKHQSTIGVLPFANGMFGYEGEVCLVRLGCFHDCDNGGSKTFSKTVQS